ncbi:hypothetical protein MSAN_01078900 [Mycena sanguinolenta]|uniref:DUF6534 domain-containing protein n=1 Tax=Mycena sanguinolenta TaxID=230812 RepID=A0A8H7DA11_9AGAR|nr:hypothetical protein MSAN_01078900 [Mycena sanguinolenta]
MTSSFPSDGNVASAYAEIWGPVYWGFCATLVLCGVSTLQGYHYFTRYNDKQFIRFLAGFILLLDFVSMALICQSAYYYMIPHYGSLAPLNAVTGELSAECLISAIITFISQMYFVYQLQIVGSQTRVASLMSFTTGLLGVVSLAGGIGCAAVMFIHPQSIFMDRNRSFIILAGINKAFGAGADVVATIAMCMFLKSADTGISGTSSLLRSLMHLVINRGLLVTFGQTLMFILFFTSTARLYWVAVHINTTKLYVNTFFAMLNARTSGQDAYSPHFSVGGFSSGRAETVVQRESSQEIEKFSELNSHNFGLDAIKVTTTSTVIEM